VRFEGKEHAKEGHACKDCHPALFTTKHRTAVMTMAALNSGRFCGACHNGTAAFSTKDPKKCHECHRQGRKEKHNNCEDHKHKDHD
jgi:c(7)-type cytochrome triheme protein